ncbi:MAG: PKD domain-containing protein [Saprospiraceae bacterium]
MKIDFVSSNVSLADHYGNQAFYFNGKYILGGGNTFMTNGSNMSMPSSSVHQKAVGLPLPNDDHKYILIHKDINAFPSLQALASFRLLYSIITFPPEGGYGAVTEKRTLVLEDTMHAGHMTACKHANGRDWWVLSKKLYSDTTYVFMVTPEGMKLSHIQEIGTYNHIEDFGEAKFSPNGQKYCATYASTYNDSTTYVHVFDFDRCSGLLSSEQIFTLPESTLSSGAAFSPNSRFLYLPLKFRLYQVDLQAPVPDTMLIDFWDGTYYKRNNYWCPTFWGPMLNGPDGRLYSANYTCSTQYLNVIEEPNLPGALCHPRQKGIVMPTQHGSPPNFPHYRLGPEDGSACDTLGINNVPWAWWRYAQDSTLYGTLYFKDLTSYEPTYWLWDFGDGQISTEQHPQHSYTAPGTYTVCLIAGNANGADTLCRTIELATVSVGSPIAPNVHIEVWPNPFNDVVTLQWSGDYLPLRAHLRLYDMLGRPVHTQQVYAGWNRVDLPNLPVGSYFWTVDDAGVVLERGQVVRQ